MTFYSSLTPQARTAVENAARFVVQANTPIRLSHLVWGLLNVDDDTARLLAVRGFNSLGVSAWLRAQGGEPVNRTTGPFSPEATSLLRRAGESPTSIGTADLLRQILTAGDPEVATLCEVVGVTVDTLLADLGGPDTTGSATAGAAAPTHCTDLTAAAAAGDLDPVWGREAELARTVKVLARRTKNNPVLLGDPGVGKTAVVEALAHKMASGDVPAALRGRRLLRVDLASLVAGCRLRGDFEERVQALTDAAVAERAVLFIDELHMITGVTGEDRTGGDASNMLKEELARGQLTVIGATTTAEYRKRIAVDPALDRRFTRIEVAEPDVATVTEILRRLAPGYTEHHGVTYTDDALTAAAVLADRHMRDRRNPDKAIDVIDEAGAQVACADGQHDRVVTDELVADVVSQMSGVEVRVVSGTARERLLAMENTLTTRVIGQDHAVSAVSRAVRRRRSGLASGTRPASLLFAGPTGVGKTELAKQLADYLGTRLVRFDMGEYGEKHAVARLVGAPPGYQGHDEGGQLTEAVSRHPGAVVLLDEVDKAHPDVFDTLLQVLDDGRLTDGRGRTVSFTDTIVVMTTNAGATSRAASGFLAVSGHDTAAATRRAVKDMFRPEFVNRLDDIVVFDPLDADALTSIVTGMVAELVVRAAVEGVRVTVDDTVIGHLAELGNDPEYGARPLRRAVERELTDPLSDTYLATGATAAHVTVRDACVVVEPQLATVPA